MYSVSGLSWLLVYNSLVLTMLLLVQIYFMVAFMFLQRKQNMERRNEAQKQLELARAHLQATDTTEKS